MKLAQQRVRSQEPKVTSRRKDTAQSKETKAPDYVARINSDKGPPLLRFHNAGSEFFRIPHFSSVGNLPRQTSYRLRQRRRFQVMRLSQRLSNNTSKRPMERKAADTTTAIRAQFLSSAKPAM